MTQSPVPSSYLSTSAVHPENRYGVGAALDHCQQHKTHSCLTLQFSSVTQSCPTLCNPMDCSTPGLPVHHQLLAFTQTYSIESVMPSNHLILCHTVLLLLSIFPSVRVFSNESVLRLFNNKTIFFLFYFCGEVF